MRASRWRPEPTILGEIACDHSRSYAANKMLLDSKRYVTSTEFSSLYCGETIQAPFE